jgi:crotonobetainyl-CoA:carnitine CoA-transferase CaiB-like acyl-CoA transferase
MDLSLSSVGLEIDLLVLPGLADFGRPAAVFACRLRAECNSGGQAMTINPLHGLKVLDVSQGIAGPYCGALLARYGADVVKVEPPSGDWARGVGQTAGGHSALSAVYNVGKQGMKLDLKKAEAVELFLELAAQVDVVLESSRPGVADRIGIGYAAVKARNPRIVYLSISGFGEAGPYAERPCTDTVGQAFSGLMSNNLGMDGIPHNVDIPIVDIFTGLFAFQAVSMALMARQQTGEGRYCPVSLMGSIAEVQAAKMIDFHLEGGPPKTINAPAGAFKASDGYVALTTLHDGHFATVCKAIGAEHLIDDSKYAKALDRVDNNAQLRIEIEAVLAGDTRANWVRRLQDAGALSDQVNDLGDWMANPHVKSTQGYVMAEQPGLGPIPRPAPAAGTSANTRPAPTAGQDTDAVLGSFGIDAARIQRLRQAEAI